MNSFCWRVGKAAAQTNERRQDRDTERNPDNREIGSVHVRFIFLRMDEPSDCKRHHDRDDRVDEGFEPVIVIAVAVVGDIQDQRVSVCPVEAE